ISLICGGHAFVAAAKTPSAQAYSQGTWREWEKGDSPLAPPIPWSVFFYRTPRGARGERFLPVALRGGADFDPRRRWRVGDDDLWSGPGQSHRVMGRTSFPS